MCGGLNTWRERQALRLALVDGIVVIWAVAGAQVIRFGLPGLENSAESGRPYLYVSVILAIVWWLLLGAWGSRKSLILGSGSDEYKRVSAASLWLFGLIAIGSYVLRIDTARGYVGIALPFGLMGLLFARWVVRQHLGMDRAQGKSMLSLMLIGGPSSVVHLAESLRRSPYSGYLPIAAYTPGHLPLDGVQLDLGLPVLGSEPDPQAILSAIERCGAEGVAISAGVQLHPQTLRQLGWELAARNVSLIMAPALTDIAGPRIHTQPVSGLPLIHVTTPTLQGSKQVAKRLFDVMGSAALIAFLSPVMLVVALSVKMDSRGRILFRQQRIGISSSPFMMLKFRSMVADAEQLLANLESENEGNGVLFKIKNDPRVTQVGAIIRRFSLDELPQLFNVLGGTMSLVGPRPPLPVEVDDYEEHVRRRLMVKPGMTGLWQVSGRSNLSWQDTVRLDLYYVENWSFAGDILILLKTARAVLKRDGAY